MLLGIVAGKVARSPLTIALEEKPLDLSLLQLANVLAR
jgi:hypothetical protein